MKQFLFMSILLIGSACMDIEKSDQLRQLDELTVSLNEVNESFLSMDVKRLSSTLHEIDQVQKGIKEALYYDTLKLETVKKMDDFKRIGVMLTLVEERIEKVPSIIENQQTSLNNLKKDIQLSVGNRSKYNENIRFESENVSQIIEFVEDCVKIEREATETFHTLQDDLQSILIDLEAEKKEQ